MLASGALQFAFDKATTEGKITIAALVVLSFLSWTVIVTKARQLYLAVKLTRKFIVAFDAASNPLELQRYLSLGETAYMAEKRALAVDYVRRHPQFFVVVTLRRVVCYWTGFWSFSHEFRQIEPFALPNIFFCTVMTLLMLRGARRLWRRNRNAALPYLVLIVIFPMTYYITHSWMDSRQPIEAAIVVLSIAGCISRKSMQSAADESTRSASMDMHRRNDLQHVPTLS